MMTEAAALSVDIAETAEAIDRLAADWTALEEATPEATGFQSFAWCRQWIEAQSTTPHPSRPCVVTVREAGRVVMLWPLQIEHQAQVGIARWIGEPLTQYGDILAEPGAGRAIWFEAARARLKQMRGIDLFAFSRLREGSLYSALAGKGKAADATTPLCAPFVDLKACAQDRSRHKSMARRTKQLATMGPVSMRTIEDPKERAEVVRITLSQKRSWLNAKALYSSGLSHPAADRFLEGLAEKGHLRVHALLVGEDKAATEIGFANGKAYRSLLGSFDLRFSAGSPGHALTTMLLAQCAAEGFDIFDFLAPGDPYKTIWAKESVEIGASLEPVTLLGHAGAFALGRLRPLAKRLQTALPHGARAALRRIAAPA